MSRFTCPLMTLAVLAFALMVGCAPARAQPNNPYLGETWFLTRYVDDTVMPDMVLFFNSGACEARAKALNDTQPDFYRCILVKGIRPA